MRLFFSSIGFPSILCIEEKYSFFFFRRVIKAIHITHALMCRHNEIERRREERRREGRKGEEG